MEKADVLEMTVHYLRELKRREQKQKGKIYLFLWIWSCIIYSVSGIIKEMISFKCLFVKLLASHALKYKTEMFLTSKFQVKYFWW